MGHLTKENYQYFVNIQIEGVKIAKKIGCDKTIKRIKKCLIETLEDASLSGFPEFQENIDKELLK